MCIREESPRDAAAIDAVHRASFPTPGEARLVDALRRAGKLEVSLVAHEPGELVGHVAFSPVSVVSADDIAAGGLGLAPLAVLPEHRRRGIASRLVRAGLEACDRAGRGFVVVLGDPAYYRRFGFRAAADRGLRDEYRGGDAFQVLELRAGNIPSSGGLVKYAAEFAALDDEACRERSE